MKILFFSVIFASICFMMFTSPIFALENNVISKLNEPFNLKVNQTASIASENIEIKLINVSEDSRCPVGVQCIWQGQVTVNLNLIKNNNTVENFNLTNRSGDENLASKLVDGYQIKVVKVEPYPTNLKKLSPSDYNVTLEISKSLNQTVPEFPFSSIMFLASVAIVILLYRVKMNIFY